MTPEERHADAIAAAREWRDEEREKHPSLMRLVAERYGLEEIAPGCWYAEKGDDERGTTWV